MKELVLNIWFEWKCETCNKRQDSIENEEWPFCCGKPMKYQPMKKYEAKP